MVLIDGVQRMENNESKPNNLVHDLSQVLFVVLHSLYSFQGLIPWQ